MKNLTNKKYWNKTWKNTSFRKKKILFQDIFNKFLIKDKNKKCIEIGCVPGRFLAHFYKKFNYQISGLDDVSYN